MTDFSGGTSHVLVIANTRHSPGTPFNSWAPRSSNSIPEPATRSLTVDETSTGQLDLARVHTGPDLQTNGAEGFTGRTRALDGLFSRPLRRHYG